MANAASAASQPSLTARTAWGFAWMMGDTVGGKVIQIFGQIVLAWLLDREHFGEVAIAYVVFMFAWQLQDGGLREVLVHRQRTFRHWASPALWMVMAFGLPTGAIIAIAAPIASLVFHAPVTGLLLILALVAPITAASVPPHARLQNELRFKALAMIGISSTALTITLQILFAWLGFGAYSWIIPQPIRFLYRAVIMWSLAPIRVRRSPQIRRWRYLMPDGFRLVTSNLLRVAVYQGGYLILGLLFSTTVVGVYYFAFSLSMQTIQLLTMNLARVLFPALSSLQLDINRQRDAFLRAAKTLAAAGVPICLLQAALAEPVIYILFQEKWYPAIIVLQVLCIGMPLRLVLDISESMIKAQGRFRTFLVLTAAYAAAFLGLVYTAARVADEQNACLAVAVAVAISLLIFGPLHVYIAVRPAGAGWREVIGVYAAPGVSGIIAVGLAWALSLLIPAEPGRNLGQMARVVVTVVAAGALYLPLIRRTAPGAWNELRQQVLRFRMRTP